MNPLSRNPGSTPEIAIMYLSKESFTDPTEKHDIIFTLNRGVEMEKFDTSPGTSKQHNVLVRIKFYLSQRIDNVKRIKLAPYCDET